MSEMERLIAGFTLAGAALAQNLLAMLAGKGLLSREEAAIVVNEAIIGLASYRTTEVAETAAVAEQVLQKTKLALAPAPSRRPT